MNWNERFELAKAYYEHHGNLRVVIGFKTKDGYTYDEDGFELGKWVSRQRHQYKIHETTPEHYEKLKSIGMVFDDLNELVWDELYDLANIYLEHYGNLSISRDFRTINGYEPDENGKNLEAWFKVQKYRYQHKNLCEYRMEKMKLLFQKFETIRETVLRDNELKWHEMYSLAQKYYEHYGNLCVSRDFKTNNGYELDENGIDLGSWLREQRRDYRKGQLSDEKIQLLKKIGFVFTDMLNAEWERMYALAKTYYEHYGNLKIPRQFKTKNGYEPDAKGSNLGKWLNTQYCRNFKGTISDEEIEKLKAIGMVFENQKNKKWDLMYELAKKYYEHHGNLIVPSNFKTKNGYEPDENGLSLGVWVNAQRSNYLNKQLSQAHIDKLKLIGMVFGKLSDIKWDAMYQLAQIYYQHYGHLMVDEQFITENGYDYSEKGEKLGLWISNQRKYYRSGDLCQSREQKLREIGMSFENQKYVEWEYMYSLAVAYYKEYHNLGIYTDFRTYNGTDYDPQGKRLGEWICDQRLKYKRGVLSQDKIVKLELIGMLFNPRNNKEQNQQACMDYMINYKKYKKQIDIITHREFVAKLEYLKSQGLSFVIDGKLNPIFFMSSINMQVRYGVSLEELMSNYQKSKNKEKVL